MIFIIIFGKMIIEKYLEKILFSIIIFSNIVCNFIKEKIENSLNGISAFMPIELKRIDEKFVDIFFHQSMYDIDKRIK